MRNKSDVGYFGTGRWNLNLEMALPTSEQFEACWTILRQLVRWLRNVNHGQDKLERARASQSGEGEIGTGSGSRSVYHCVNKHFRPRYRHLITIKLIRLCWLDSAVNRAMAWSGFDSSDRDQSSTVLWLVDAESTRLTDQYVVRVPDGIHLPE